MLFSKKTKIVYAPIVEPVLEVEAIPELVAIDFATIEGNVKYIYFGKLTDYDGKEYDFEWDDSQKKLSRLTGSGSNQFIWNSATEVLTKQLVESDITNLETHNSILEALSRVEVKVEPQIVVKEVVKEVVREVPVREIPKQVTRSETPQEVSMENFFDEEEDINEDEIVQRAQKYLQESQSL